MGSEPSLQNDFLAPHVERLARSFAGWTGRSLGPPASDGVAAAAALYQAPFVVVSHGTEVDPIFNYGNLKAQELFQMTWDQLTSIPSRCSAEPLEQAERERLMTAVRQHGFINDYRGVRVSAKGDRFLIEQAIVWNVIDDRDQLVGQAAMFDRWTPVGPAETV